MDLEFTPVQPQQGTRTWVVATDGRRARIFELVGDVARVRSVLPCELVAAAPMSAHRESDLSDSITMRPRRSARTARGHRDALLAEAFARQIAVVLHEARIEQRVDRLVLVAPPSFLRVLRGSLDKRTRALVVDELRVADRWSNPRA